MPKKIRRSNNRLKKTNRKFRKTANRKRLKKFVGGANAAAPTADAAKATARPLLHWVGWASKYYSFIEIKECKDQIDALKDEDSLARPGEAILIAKDSLFAKLIENKLTQLSTYIESILLSPKVTAVEPAARLLMAERVEAERVAAEREAAEREAAEREAAERVAAEREAMGGPHGRFRDEFGVWRTGNSRATMRSIFENR